MYSIFSGVFGLPYRLASLLIGLTADFGQIWILEIQVPGLLETSNYVRSIIGGQLDHPQNFRRKSFKLAEIWDTEICV